MRNQPKKNYEQPPAAVNMALLLAVVGCLITVVQAVLLLVRGNALCLNDGCEIVETLTTVPPVVVNLVGCLYFLCVFGCMRKGRGGARSWLVAIRSLLLAGLAAEGVLVGYQYFVAGVFCSYCLIVFGLIVVLNLLMGGRQMVGGAAVWLAVFLAFAALTFVPVGGRMAPVLAKGVYGRLARPDAGGRLYLFFSSDCSHCEEVMATIDNHFSCDLSLNPVDSVGKLPVPDMVSSPGYSSAINRSFLRNMGIEAVPTLLVKTQGKMEVLTGGRRIQQYLEKNCQPASAQSQLPAGEVSGQSKGGDMSLLQSASPEAICTLGTECNNVPANQNQK